jgi:hypothetical protein
LPFQRAAIRRRLNSFVAKLFRKTAPRARRAPMIVGSAHFDFVSGSLLHRANIARVKPPAIGVHAPFYHTCTDSAPAIASNNFS